MGAAWRDDHPNNVAAVHRHRNLEKGSKHSGAIERKNMSLIRSQHVVLEAVYNSYLQTGESPTCGEIAASLGLRSQAAVAYHIPNLEQHGYVAPKPFRRSRTLVLTLEGQMALSESNGSKNTQIAVPGGLETLAVDTGEAPSAHGGSVEIVTA